MKTLYHLLDNLHLLPLARLLLAVNLYNPLKAALSMMAIKEKIS